MVFVFSPPPMKRSISLAASVVSLAAMAACSSNSAWLMNQNQNTGNSQSNGRPMGQQMRQQPPKQDLQRFLNEANNADDKTSLTQEEFEAELKTMMDSQKSRMAQNSSRSSIPAPMPRSSRSSVANAATTFWKYTDSKGQTVLLALNADGEVINKWPMLPPPPARGQRN